MHCNLTPPEPRPQFPALITTPCQVWRRWTYPLPYWALTLNICSISSVMWWNSLPNYNAIKQSVEELLRCQCLTLWPWTCFKCCTRLWYHFHQVWPSTTYPCVNYSVFSMQLRYFTLWTWPLTRWPWKWSKSVQNSSDIEQCLADLLVI